MKFNDLELIDPILTALENKGYQHPTPIQQQAIPLVLKHQDILGISQTGTGKTAAFCIPIIQLIHKKDGHHTGKPHLRSLIVTPTRELAIQIHENLEAYSKSTNIRHAVIYGGVKQHDQVRALNKGVHILVATPGRFLDLIQQGFISLKQLKIFVLDEADRMLDMGFIHDINKIISMLPEQRQSLFFSATMPDKIVALSKKILNKPIKVEVTPESTTAETIKQYVYYTNKDLKLQLLLDIIEKRQIEQALVFSRTKHGADRIARKLKNNNIHAGSIHGDKSQPQRVKALKAFKAGKTQILVATDIAARGIDISKLKYVINYDVPNEPESYVHRIGRSGRAGEEGSAISLCEPEENAYIKDIEKLIAQKIEVIQEHPFPQTDKPMTAAEKKEWMKEKQRRRQEFFANRKAKRNQKGAKSQKEHSPKTDKKKPTPNKKTNESNPENASKNKKSKNQGSKSRNTSHTKSKKRSSLKDKYMWPLE